MFPVVLAAVGITAMLLIGRRKWYGWLVGIFAETLWTSYAIESKQYGFILASFFYACVYLKNLFAWRVPNVVQSEQSNTNKGAEYVTGKAH